ncbi:MAG TPA: HAD family hydrolase [Anaerolineae bacterium]|nr:HAD family hydrolase [Anaerolineae bacterium]HIQ04192.1 HAD family hydrolase [Anaerolineae bacterium]
MTPTTLPDLVISFDLDEVLLPRPIGRCVFPVVVLELAKEIAESHKKPLQTVVEELRHRIELENQRRVGNDHGLLSAYDWDSIFTTVVRSLGLQQQVRIAPYVEALCQNPRDIPAYPGVWEGLTRLRELGTRLLVVTNGYARYQLPVLRALGLDQFFERIATSDVAGCAKPDPRIFRWAFQGLDGRRNIHVGDWLQQDVYGAHQAGLEAIWFRRDLPEPLASLAPKERPSSPAFRLLIEARLYREGVQASDLTPYWPEYVVRDLDELPEVLGFDPRTDREIKF